MRKTQKIIKCTCMRTQKIESVYAMEKKSYILFNINEMIFDSEQFNSG